MDIKLKHQEYEWQFNLSGFTLMFNIITVSVHDFGPGFDKVTYKFFLIVILSINFRIGT